ncbi:SDR family NAD(P)-dependent oxidoreductase [Pseudonocardia acaciae]|uniref:SDR family NAD(P)-dependent oxidoreductase n=1 Tax=Pseudonocardia acaciae TaxID=551276 RepID=UPI00048DF931|nr:SDR family oxidoreductase [Pseudonocardia acaciae]
MADPTGLADTRCLVVGAASGIGDAVATLLAGASAGAEFVAADLPTARWPDPRPGEHRVDIDVTDPSSVDAAVAAAGEALGRIDAVVNCAGVLGRVQPSSHETVQEFERLLAVNLTGAFILSRAVLPAMAARGYGRLVHLSSTAGKEGSAGMTGYSAAKAGVLGLVKALAREYADTGVTVNAIAPGTVETPLIAAMSERQRAEKRRLIPMGRFGLPREAAELIAFVISPQASFTTGAVFDLSGGRATY